MTASAQLAFDVSVSGTPNSFDLDAATMVVEQENERRAALDPPEDPLPIGTTVQLRDSYLSIIVQRIAQVHASYAKQAAEKELAEQSIRDKWLAATPAQRAAAVAALSR